MVGGQDARSAEEGAGQERATFYIENVDRLRPFQPQPGSGNLQKGRKPLGAAAVAQDGIAGEFGPEVLRFRAQMYLGVLQNAFLQCGRLAHGAPSLHIRCFHPRQLPLFGGQMALQPEQEENQGGKQEVAQFAGQRKPAVEKQNT